MYKSAICFVLLAGQGLALDTQALSDEQGSGKLYFTGPGYTINLIPQAILLGLLSFLAVYFLGIDLAGAAPAEPTGYEVYSAAEPSYEAPAPAYSAESYSAPAESYSAPARSSAYPSSYDTYEVSSRKKRSSF